MTLPIPIVVNSFSTFYNNRCQDYMTMMIITNPLYRLWRTEVEQKKKEKTRQIQNDLKQGKHRNRF